MATHKMTVKLPYFDMIANGIKTFELRLFDDKRSKIQPGDKIIFSNSERESVEATVVGLVRARNFKELFTLIPVQNCGFPEEDIAVETMKQFYDEDAQAKFGVVAIAVK